MEIHCIQNKHSECNVGYSLGIIIDSIYLTIYGIMDIEAFDNRKFRVVGLTALNAESLFYFQVLIKLQKHNMIRLTQSIPVAHDQYL